MVPTVRIYAISACLLAGAFLVLPATARQTVSDEEASTEKSMVMCKEWGGASTTDPGVKIEARKDTEHTPTMWFTVDAENHYGVAMMANMDEVFPGTVYNSHENVHTQHRTTNLDGAFIHRTITTDLIDIMAVSGLETDTPQLIWQRFRLDDGVPLETVLIADCRR